MVTAVPEGLCDIQNCNKPVFVQKNLHKLRVHFALTLAFCCF